MTFGLRHGSEKGKLLKNEPKKPKVTRRMMPIKSLMQQSGHKHWPSVSLPITWICHMLLFQIKNNKNREKNCNIEILYKNLVHKIRWWIISQSKGKKFNLNL